MAQRGTAIGRQRIDATIRGAWVDLTGGLSDGVLNDTLAVLHPKPWFSRAYRENRWDGRVRFWRRRSSDCVRIPAGLLGRLSRELGERHPEYALYSSRDPQGLSAEVVSGLDLDVVEGMPLFPHQRDVAMRLLARRCGVAQAPTGSGKTLVVFTIAYTLYKLYGWRTLVIVPRRGLLTQTVACFREWSADRVTIGAMGASRREDGVITVGTGQTLRQSKAHKRADHKHETGSRYFRADAEIRKCVECADVLILDECQFASTDDWYDVAMHCPAQRRYGVSGTPLIGDTVADVRLTAATGPLVARVREEDLQRSSLFAAPRIVVVDAPTLAPPRRLDRRMKWCEVYRQAIVDNDALNRAVIDAVRWLVLHGRTTIVFCRLRTHFNDLQRRLDATDIPYVSVWGASSNAARADAKRQLACGEAKVALVTTVWDVGEDVKGIGALVFAEGGKSVVQTLQRVGRGTRRDTEDVWVVDFVPPAHTWLIDHAINRIEHYRSRGYDVTIMSEWVEPTYLPFEDWSVWPQRRV
jgi:superfamily II DNA or RNA helicase